MGWTSCLPSISPFLPFAESKEYFLASRVSIATLDSFVTLDSFATLDSASLACEIRWQVRRLACPPAVQVGCPHVARLCRTWRRLPSPAPHFLRCRDPSLAQLQFPLQNPLPEMGLLSHSGTSSALDAQPQLESCPHFHSPAFPESPHCSLAFQDLTHTRWTSPHATWQVRQWEGTLPVAMVTAVESLVASVGASVVAMWKAVWAG